LPYYYQVYDYLLNKIKDGKVKEGYQLPNEILLCDMFHVSRTTIREAFRELESNGYITRGRGQGTFISKPAVESSALQKVSSIADDLKEKGIKTEKKILDVKIIDSDEKLQKY
jgi:GntR family transcriptional regulator